MPNDSNSSDNLRPPRRISSKTISNRSSSGLETPAIVLFDSAPEKASYGVLIDEIRSGSKILVPSKSAYVKDPLVEKIQTRINQLLLENKSGDAVEIDGFFSPRLGDAISRLRNSLPNPPCKPGEHIDEPIY